VLKHGCMCLLSAESEEFRHPSLCNTEGILQFRRLHIGHLGGEERTERGEVEGRGGGGGGGGRGGEKKGGGGGGGRVEGEERRRG